MSRHQFLLAGGHAFGELAEVQIRAANFREQLAFFFLHMVLDVFTEHFDLGVPQLVSRSAFLDLADEILGGRVLDLRCGEQFGVFRRVAGGGIEQLFFQLGMYGQLAADVLRELELLRVIARSLFASRDDSSCRYRCVRDY